MKYYPKIIFCNFIHAGSCSIASAARKAADIRRRTQYQQHSTVGVLVDRDFPESVERFYSEQEEFKQKLAVSFINSSILTDEKIKLRLNNEKVDEWKVELTVMEEEATVDLSFNNSSMKMKTFSSKSPRLLQILKALSTIVLEDVSMVAYLHVLVSSLKSKLTARELKMSFKEKLQNSCLYI